MSIPICTYRPRRIKTPSGYQRIAVKTRLRMNDLYADDREQYPVWRFVRKTFRLVPVNDALVFIRRRPVKPPKPPLTEDQKNYGEAYYVPEGFFFLPHGAMLIAGDKYWSRNNQRWETTTFTGQTAREDSFPYIRQSPDWRKTASGSLV